MFTGASFTIRLGAGFEHRLEAVTTWWPWKDPGPTVGM
jgi:hypothetical protein